MAQEMTVEVPCLVSEPPLSSVIVLNQLQFDEQLIGLSDQMKHELSEVINALQRHAFSVPSTYLCYSPTCTPAQLSLLSEAIAKYSAFLKGRNRKKITVRNVTGVSRSQ